MIGQDGHHEATANGHSAFGTWALEQKGDPVTDVMRALRPASQPANSTQRQEAAAHAPDEGDDDDDEADGSWWDVDLPRGGADAEAVAAARDAEDHEAECDPDEALGTTVWQRADVGAELANSQAFDPSWSAAERQPGVAAAEQQTASGTTHQAVPNPSAQEAAAPLTEAHYSAQEQWRLAYEQWYAAYMHWYDSYTQWHEGYQQHCAGQAPVASAGAAAHAEL